MHTATNRDGEKRIPTPIPHDNGKTIAVRSKIDSDRSSYIYRLSLAEFHCEESVNSFSTRRLSIEEDIWRSVLSIDFHRMRSNSLFQSSDDSDWARNEADSSTDFQTTLQREQVFSLTDAEGRSEQKDHLFHCMALWELIYVIEVSWPIKKPSASTTNAGDRSSTIATMLRRISGDKTNTNRWIGNPNKSESIEEDSKLDRSWLENPIRADQTINKR